MSREDAIEALKVRLGIARLSSQSREQLEGILDDLSRVAFIDDPATSQTNEAMAVIRKAVRSGEHSREDVLRVLASECLRKNRLGARVRQQVEGMLKTARQRKVISTSGDQIICATPTFDAYTDEFLQQAILEVMGRNNRVYRREDVNLATVQSLGYSARRDAMQTRVDSCIDALASAGELEIPQPDALVRPRSG